jgi:hypothetical protein
LGEGAPLLKEAGSFEGEGPEQTEIIFDLGGNAAEWVVGKDGSGRPRGGSADLPADPERMVVKPAPGYIGFRVIRSTKP